MHRYFQKHTPKFQQVCFGSQDAFTKYIRIDTNEKPFQCTCRVYKINVKRHAHHDHMHDNSNY